MSKLRNLLATTALAAAAAIGAPAHAGVPTFDSAAIAEATKTATNTSQQLNQMISIATSAQQMLQSVGGSGPGAFFLGNGAWEELTGSQGAADASILTQLPNNLCAVRGCPDDSKQSQRYAQGQIGSVSEGVMFANKSFYAGEYADPATRRDFQTARQNAVRVAAISGYGVAVAVRSSLANTAASTQQIETVINEAGSLREDVQANSAAVIALHRQLAQLQGVMASMLELKAAGAIANDSALMKHGGATIAEAPQTYEPGDYASPGGPRVRITNTATMLGPSGNTGSSFASSVLGSTSNPIVQAAAETSGVAMGDAVTGLIEVAKVVARETGNYEVAQGLNTLNGVARSGTPEAMLWAGADAIADTSSNSQLRDIVDLGRTASRTRNPNDINAVFDLARQAAQASNHSEALQYIDTLQDGVRTGQQPPDQAIRNAAATVADITGDSELAGYIDSGNNILGDIERGTSADERRAMYELANGAIETNARRTGNGDLQDVADSARQAGETIPWDNPDTPADESAAQPWDNPNTPVDESATGSE
jgi:hypothetical protein